jgi:hypothetical protein
LRTISNDWKFSVFGLTNVSFIKIICILCLQKGKYCENLFIEIKNWQIVHFISA